MLSFYSCADEGKKKGIDKPKGYIVRITNPHKPNHPARKLRGRCDALAADADKLAHSSRRKSLELIVVSMKYKKEDTYVAFYVLYILWVGHTICRAL